MRRRARLIAVTLVLCTAATIAYGDFTATPTAPSAGSGSLNTVMRAVVSVRNELPDPVVATVMPTTTTGCLGLTLTDIDGMSATQWSFDGYAQRQFVISGQYTTTGIRTCPWNVDAGAGSTGSFTTTFSVGAGGEFVNAQPNTFDFRVTGKISETQTAYLQNYGTSPLSYMQVTIDDGGMNVLTFASGPCAGQQTCAGGTIAPGSFHEFDFRCTPPAGAMVTGQITYMIGASFARVQGFTCRSGGQPPVIDIVPASVVLQGAQGAATSLAVDVAASDVDSLESATIVGPDAAAFRLVAPSPCSGGQSCTFTPAIPILPGTSVTVECTPGMSQKTATLRVKGTAHAMDLDEADLSCVADGGVSASPQTLDFGEVEVTSTSAPQTVTIQNLSTTAPTNVLVDTGHPDWLADSCTSQPCSIPANSSIDVELRFAPSVPAQNNRTLTIAVGGNPAASVDLIGMGVGSRMRVTSHQAPYSIDFGTIGLGSQRTRTVSLQADGNRSLNVAIGVPAAPFSTSVLALDLAAGAEDSFDIVCQSSTAGMFTGMVSLSPGPDDHVYAADTPKLDVQCNVANTPVQVSPDELDFGEVRRNTPPPMIQVEIHNPSAAAIPLDYVRFADDEGPLALSVPPDATLDPGETINVSISLATTAEVEVQNALEVGVGGEQLVTPITGKVVTASARVTPTALRLGSVCVGTPIDEPVKLVNNGTARLRVQPPMMQQPFAVLFVDPVSYPEGGAPLAPLEEATASVRIATAEPGRVSGDLTWDVDAPDAPFVIEASLDIKDAGIAVSPIAIGFDQVRVDERSDRRTIRIENCGDLASEIVLDGVAASRGDAGAWELTPSRVTTRLEPGDKLTIDVRFAPTRPGPHTAIVKLAVDGVAEQIELTGNALGDTLDRESLYACSCDAPGGAAIHALPLLLAVAAIVLVPRRRRRPLSARRRT
jgi:hypothetical protein